MTNKNKPFASGYDANSSRLFRTHELNHGFDELYVGSTKSYDDLNRLTSFSRGVVNV